MPGQFSLFQYFMLCFYFEPSGVSDMNDRTGLITSVYKFTDIFDLEKIQKLQDLFSNATGVASIITEPDGKPITRPSNFCSLCSDIIRKTEKGFRNCQFSDSIIGSPNDDGPRIRRCLSGGLIDGGVSIFVEGRHIANWMIGQVLDEGYDIENMLSYADEIGVDREVYKNELLKVKRMSGMQFESVCEFLCAIAQQMTLYAIKNISLANEISRKEMMEAEIRRSNTELENLVRYGTTQLETVNIELEAANAKLIEEIAERRKAGEEIRKLNADLEKRVAERTNQLQEINARLEAEIRERIKIEEALRQNESEYRYLSYHDMLTGLYNRRFLEEATVSMDIEENLPISIALGDVNGLKLMNDAFGHDVGDKLLQKAAACIRSACKPDDVIARWGGDEFVILMPKTDAKRAEEVIRNIRAIYSNESVNSVRVSISMGWDTKNRADEDIYKVLKSAEDYMYKHKIIENQGMRSNVIDAVINALHEKNPREEQHSKRVSEICQNIGKALMLPEIEIGKLKVAGLLHDIGKLAIDDGILNKQSRLTEQEWNEIRKHPAIGYRIISSSREMLDLAECIRLHHERWDGSGYPNGLKAEAIPVAARIIALADSYDAMTSVRPYRKKMSEEEAAEEIRRNAGTQFDPEIAAVFLDKVLACGKCVIL